MIFMSCLWNASVKFYCLFLCYWPLVVAIKGPSSFFLRVLMWPYYSDYFLSFDALGPHGGRGGGWTFMMVMATDARLLVLPPLTFACYKEALAWNSTLFFHVTSHTLGPLLSLEKLTEWHKDILAICNNTDHSYGKGIFWVEIMLE